MLNKSTITFIVTTALLSAAMVSSVDAAEETVDVHVATTSADKDKAEIFNRMEPAADAQLTHIAEGRYNLERGSVLIHRNKPVQIQTPHGEVNVQSHAAVLVSVDSEVTHVVDLFDWRLGAVKVSVGKRSKSIGPGDEIALVQSDDGTSAQLAVVKDGLRRRHIKVTDMGEHHFAIADECSLLDLLVKQQLLSNLRANKTKGDKAVYEQIVKTAAAMQMTGNGDPYTVHQ